MRQNPSIALRDSPSKRLGEQQVSDGAARTNTTSASIRALIALSLIASVPWARQWLYSGSAVESMLLIYGCLSGNRFFRYLPLWATVATLNLLYAVTRRSWLLSCAYSIICYLSVCITCLIIFPSVLQFLRSRVRILPKHLYVTSDKIASFDIPALRLNGDVSALAVLRGATMSLSTLRVELHGLEVGLQLTEDVQLALYADNVAIDLCRRVAVEEVYAVIKYARLDRVIVSSEKTLTDDNALPLNANARPLDASKIVGNGDLESHGTTVLTEEQYDDKRRMICETSPVYQSHEHVKLDGDKECSNAEQTKVRAATCARLQHAATCPHASPRPIRILSLVDLLPNWLHNLLKRAPALLRSVLVFLADCHTVQIRSFNAVGTGGRLATCFAKIFGHHVQLDDELRRLENEVSHWLADTDFCIEASDVHGFGQVGMGTDQDLITYLRCTNITTYQVEPGSGSVLPASQIQGADVTFAVPLCLLPYHAHLLPSIPTDEQKQAVQLIVHEAEEQPKEAQAQSELEKLRRDVAAIAFSVHAALPIHMDQPLLDLLEHTAKEAARVIKLEKREDHEGRSPAASSTDLSLQDDGPNGGNEESSGSGGKRARLAGRLKDLRQSLKQGEQNIKQGMKNATLSGMIDDQWIVKVVEKIAEQLEQTRGDVGYLGEISVALESYRRSPSKSPWTLLQ